MLRTPLLPPSWGSLQVLLLSCDDRSCLFPPQHHSVSDPKGPAALPSPPCPMLWVGAETTSGTVAPGASSLPGATDWRGSPSLSQCTGGWTQLTRNSVRTASPPQQRQDFSFNFFSLPPPHWLFDFVTNASITPFNPLPQRSHPWVQHRLKPLRQPFY